MFFNMKFSIKLCQFFIIISIVLSCNKTQKKVFDKDLADKLEQMVALDQLVASNAFPPESHSHLNQHQWEQFKDSVYMLNEKRL